MKTLGKLQISSAKIIKNDELISLRGGYYTYECWVDGGSWSFMMSSVQDNEFAATEECNDFLAGYGECTYCFFA